MAQLKISFGITPNQLTALQSLCETQPDKYSMPVNDGRATRFEFPIEELGTVDEYLKRAGSGRAVDLSQYDLSDDIFELDWAWSTQNDHLVFSRVDIQLQKCVSIVAQKTLSESECESILEAEGYDTKFGIELLLEELPEVKWTLLAAFLIRNPVFLCDEGASPLQGVGNPLKTLATQPAQPKEQAQAA